MALEGFGFALGVIPELRHQISSIETRISNYRQGPHTFETVDATLKRVTQHIGELEAKVGTAPSALPSAISSLFNDTLRSVSTSLTDANSTLEKYCSSAFAASSSGVRAKVKSMVVRAVRATALRDHMASVESQLDRASNQLLHLISMFSNALKVAEQQDVLVPKIDNLAMAVQEQQDVLLPKFSSLSIVDNAEAVYRPGTNAPQFTHLVNLKFDERDADGNLTTPEGILKHSVLSSASSAAVTAAAGVLTPACGVVGMAGVGKTVALQGLAFDEDIRDRFPDGILYISLGQEATLQTAIREIGRILSVTGATALVATVSNSSSLREAVDYAVTWFQGKICLFLVDDLWPTENNATGYLNDLRQLMRACPASRMAISTRSVAIAHGAGLIVDFAARDALGSVSESIFLSHALGSGTWGASAVQPAQRRSSVSKILGICGGLPIALSVSGCAVALLTRMHGSFESACDAYALELEENIADVGEERSPSGATLRAGILLSLKYLEVEFLKWKARNAADISHTVSSLYASLGVLSNQAWVPASVLGRLWGVNVRRALYIANLFSGMSLASLHVRKEQDGSTGQPGLMLHDLHLEFCRRQAEETQTLRVWHARLLDGYVGGTSGGIGISVCSEPYAFTAEDLVRFVPRPWWSEAVPEDGYIHMNVARHLVASKSGTELGVLLLDARWTHVRVRVGGILALQGDFQRLEECLVGTERAEGVNVPASDVKKTFKLLLNTIHLSWGRTSEGLRAFLFQMTGRLLSVRKRDMIIDAYLKSAEAHTPLPHLVPVSSFFPDPSSAQKMEIPVGRRCSGVACSPCGRFIAAVGGYQITVAKASTGDILRTLAIDYSRSIAFAGGSKKLIVAKLYAEIVVWEWETADSPSIVVEGHNGFIRCICVSRDGGQIYWGSGDRTFRIWDLNTCTQSQEFPQQSEVMSIAICACDQRVALGLADGTLKIVDICTGATVFEDINAHQKLVGSIALSPNGQCLATGSSDMTIRLWNTETWKEFGKSLEAHNEWVLCIAFSPDGQHIASGVGNGYIVLWNLESGKIVGRTPQHSQHVSSIAYTCDGERIVSGSDDGAARIWDARLDAISTEERAGHTRRVWGVAISHDGLRVASASEDETVRLWNAQTGAQIGEPLQGHTSGVRCVSFSPDGRQVVSGSGDKTVRLWDTKTSKQIGAPLVGHTEFVLCVSFCSDGLRIVSGSGDKTARIWNSQTGAQIGDALEGHITSVSRVSESVDGKYIACTNISSSAFVWEIATRTVVWRIKRFPRTIDWRIQRFPRTILEREESNKGSGEITDEEAEKIIRSCGQETPHLVKNLRPNYTAQVYSEGTSVYSNALDEIVPLGTSPSFFYDWKYELNGKVFAAGLMSGRVAVCKLREELT